MGKWGSIQVPTVTFTSYTTMGEGVSLYVQGLRDESNQEMRRFLREKLQDARDRQKKRNTNPRMR